MKSECNEIGIVAAGIDLGIFPISYITNFFENNILNFISQEYMGLKSSCKLQIGLSIHSLIGHNVNNIIKLCNSLRIREALFWIHDYSSICSGFNLLRNDIKYCGLPISSSQSCQICSYGLSRYDQKNAHMKIFNKMKMTYIAPSETASKIWKKEYGLNKKVIISPHCSLSYDDSINDLLNNSVDSIDRKLNIAFIGHPVFHKGYSIFRELCLRNSHNARYNFYHLGSSRELGMNYIYKNITVNVNNLNATIDALKSCDIDIVVIWSVWPETYSFTATEAICAGAKIITNSISGNAYVLAKEYNSLIEFDNIDDLFASFEKENIFLNFPSDSTKTYYNRQFNDLSLGFLFEKCFDGAREI